MGKAFQDGPVSEHDPNALGRRFRERLNSGQVLLGGMVMEMARPCIVKLYRYAGFHFIYVDNEHVLFAGRPAMADFVLSARDNDLPVIAKCPELGRPEVARLLEAGVLGIQLPRTETREQVLKLIDHMRFPPIGTRAAAPLLGNVDYEWPSDMNRWMQDCNDSTFVVGHIETKRGFENAEQIISTPGLDMIYIGVLDFSISMGHASEPDHPEVRDAMQKILEICVKYNVAFGTTCKNAQAAGGWMARGARFFEVVDELSLIGNGARQTVEDYTLAIQTVETTYEYLRSSNASA